MGRPRTVVAEAATAAGSAWTAVARSARRPEWHSVDPSDRRAVAGPARSLSVVSDLPSPVPTVGGQRHVAGRAERPGRRPARARRLGPQRDLHRRLLCQRKKKGLHVGKTKRGKGTKIMAIADRAGLPVAITIASASPHETTLVEQTLNASFLPDNPARLIGDAAYDSDGL